MMMEPTPTSRRTGIAAKLVAINCWDTVNSRPNTVTTAFCLQIRQEITPNIINTRMTSGDVTLQNTKEMRNDVSSKNATTLVVSLDVYLLSNIYRQQKINVRNTMEQLLWKYSKFLTTLGVNRSTRSMHLKLLILRNSDQGRIVSRIAASTFIGLGII